VSNSTGRLLSLAEAQERERAQSASVTFIEVGGGPSALPSKYHTVVDFPKSVVLSCSVTMCAMHSNKYRMSAPLTAINVTLWLVAWSL